MWIAFLESTCDFLSNESKHDYATTIFYVFDDGRGSSLTLFVIKKAQNVSSGNTLDKVLKGLNNTFLKKKNPSSKTLPIVSNDNRLDSNIGHFVIK